jgi:nucleoside-diphosphate-sugar epimerase
MKVLVVGGTGLIGGDLALRLRALGHEVAIAARKPAPARTGMAALEFLPCDYLAGGLPRSDLARFEALVFAAGNDIRHAPRGFDDSTHWDRVNSHGVPRFFAQVRDAGVYHAINIGSFYPQAAPHLVETVPYVRSRKRADDGVRALATRDFRVMSINAPWIVGTLPGLTIALFAAVMRYVAGELVPGPAFAPAGGVNFMSARSLSEAVIGALARGRSGAAYLVGDQNLTFSEFFAPFFAAVGREAAPVRDEAHPLLPDSTMYFGRGKTLYYEPDAAEAQLLGYRRGDVGHALAEVVAQYRPRAGR